MIQAQAFFSESKI